MECNFGLVIKGISVGQGSEQDPFILGPASPNTVYTVENLYKDLAVLKEKNLLQDLINKLQQSKEAFETEESFKALKDFESRVVWKTFAEHMKAVGVEVEAVTAEQLANKGISIPNFENSSAVVFNGKIYLNLNSSCTTAPIHEMMHLVLGYMRSEDYKAYSKLLELAEESSEFMEIFTKICQDPQYQDMIQNDKLEEAFCILMERVVDDTIQIDNLPYDKMNSILNPFITQTFGLEQAPALLSFLKSTVSSLPIKGSTLFMRQSYKSTGYSDNIKKINMSGRITNLITKLVKDGTIKETCI